MTDLPKQRESFFQRGLIYFAIVLVVAIIIGVFVTLRLNNTTPTQSADYIEDLAKDQVTVSMLGELQKTYPLSEFDTDSQQINNNIFEGLTVLRHGRMEPALAESWTNPNQLTWRIKLRKDVKFHSGHTFKATDVKYTFEEAKKDAAKKTPTWMASYIALRVDSINVIDENTVELKTAQPDPTLLQWLTTLYVVSEEQVKRDGIGKAVGTGPYKLVKHDPEKRIINLEANENYWGGAPKVKKLSYRQYDDEEQIMGAIEKGEADIGVTTNKQAAEKLRAKGFQVITSGLSDVSYLAVDVNNDKSKYVDVKKNPLKDVRVRRAIWLGLDIPSLLKNANLEGEELSQFANKDLIGYNSSLKKPARNLERAKSLITEAGYPNGFKVTVETPFPRKAVVEEIKRQLAQIGITVELKVHEEQATFFGKLGTGDFAAFSLGYTPDTLDSTDLLNSFVHTPTQGKGESNFVKYSNQELDGLLDKASTTFSTKDRAEIIQEVHKKFVDQLPFIPLYTRNGFFVIKDDIAFKPAPFGFIFGFELSGRQKAPSTAQ
ncbi:MAG: hypothetical protein A2Z42_01755 [Candidatus Woykebacteria bacterium RBG_19FT_COMBO_43_10]|uniref:Solute-binding protein family 5 domain-containing protein n=1 Tax=Candidatus Woykebacteria bacterium RBG_19FT_COMBO_43_10 TaxID=1802598 RepID=A0A1G1WH78_9BACT|nr:MAG: hypothetical protein A2Z42_01755 [Candidatus Woykebacteria bacterium RBG_19FT_COMBO_43_10]